MRKTSTLLTLISFFAIAFTITSFDKTKKVVAKPTIHPVSSGGITGWSAAGCVCHSGVAPTPTVTITGLPPSPIVGTTYPVTVTLLGSNSHAGFNLSATSGTFSNLGTNVQQVGAELTQSAATALVAGSVQFTFDWQATAPGDVTFNVAGNNVNLDGSTGGDVWKQVSLILPVQTLPVKFNFFKGYNVNSTSNSLIWKVEQEINLKNYEVEQSCDGIQFTKITTIMPQTSNITKTYTYDHSNVNCTNKNYYRLKIVHLDGSFEYSTILSINNKIKEIEPFVFPNPVISSAGNLNVYLGKIHPIQIQLFNNTGELLKTFSNNIATISELGLPIQVKQGNYFLKLTYKDKSTKTLQFLVQ